AGFLYQPVEYIVTEGGVAAVFTGQADDPSGSIVFHTARQTALRGTDGFSPRIVLCPVSAAVRRNDGGRVPAGVVFMPRFMALPVFHRSYLSTACVCVVLAQAFLAVHRRHLTKTVMVIAGYITGTVSEGQRLTVTAPRHGFPAAGGIFRCA